MIEEIGIGLATSAVLRLAKQVETAARGRNDKTALEEAQAGRLLAGLDFGTTALRARVTLPRDVSAESVQRFLRSQAAESIAFELLVVVMTESHSSALPRVRSQWVALVGRAFPEAQEISHPLFDLLTEYYQLAVDVLKAECPGAYRRLRDESHHRRIACILEAIEATIDPSREPVVSHEALQSFVEEYRRQVRHAHRDITPPDFDSRRNVPIDELYVSPTITHADEARGDAPVTDLLAEIDRTVLLGDPGNGKSTVSQVLLYRAAQIPHGPVPFIVVLRDYAGHTPYPAIVDYLEERLSTYYQCPAPAGAVVHLMRSGRALVVFDGLDELLDTAQRRQVTEAVSLFCNRFPLVKVFVTSRRVGYLQAPMDRTQFTILEVSGFDREQVRTYVERWFGQEALSAEQVAEWTAAFMKESESVADLTETPLFLALMCIIYRGERSLPRNRPAIYERCATMLFDKWDRHRGLGADLRVGQLVDPAIKHLAYWLFTRDAPEGVPERELIAETTRYLHERSFEDLTGAERAASEFVEFCRGRAWVFTDVGTTADGERLYKFTHRTFLEYFAAYHLSRTTDSPEKLAKVIAPRVANAEWDVLAQLAVQISDKHSDRGAIRVFERLLEGRSGRRPGLERYNVLSFLIGCLTFVPISPKVLRQMTREVTGQLLAADHLGGTRYERGDLVAQLLLHARFVDQAVLEDELGNLLDEAISHGTDEERSIALSFLGVGEILLHLAGARASDDDEEAFWSAWLAKTREEHRADFAVRVGSSLEVAHYALQHQWFSLVEVLRQLDSGLTPLFVPAVSRVAELRFPGYVGLILKTTLLLPSGDSPRQRELGLSYLDDCVTYVEELGRESLPWCDDTFWPDLFLAQPEVVVKVDASLSSRQQLGAGILMACILERSSDALERWNVSDWGQLSEVVELLNQRSALSRDDALLSRMESAGFGILTDWARGGLDFVGSRPLAARIGGVADLGGS